MTTYDNKLEVLEGERFAQIIGGFDYATAAQIVVLLYDNESVESSGFAASFVKVADATNYPDAGTITLNGEGKMVFTIDTTGFTIGTYDIEVRVDVVGVLAPITKNRSKFMTIKESRT